jgi:hypothetical protein
MLQSEAISTSPWSLQNSASVSANSTTSPDGATTADTLGGTSSSSYTEQAIPWTASGNWTLSLFAKAGTSTRSYFYIVRSNSQIHGVSINWSGGVPTVNSAFGGSASIQALSSGWYRIVFQLTSVDHTVTNYLRLTSDIVSGTGTVILWGLQAEQGSFPTSYIPTTTATVTRAADVASMTGGNFTSWFNYSQSTMYTEGVFIGDPYDGNYGYMSTFDVGQNDGSFYSRIRLTDSGDFAEFQSTLPSSGTVTGGIFLAIGANAKNTKIKQIHSITNSVSASAAVNGTLGTAVISSSIQVPDRLQFGKHGAAYQTTCYLRRFAYYPVRLPDAQLQALTAT